MATSRPFVFGDSAHAKARRYSSVTCQVAQDRVIHGRRILLERIVPSAWNEDMFGVADAILQPAGDQCEPLDAARAIH